MRHLKQEAFPSEAETMAEVGATFELDELLETKRMLYSMIMDYKD